MKKERFSVTGMTCSACSAAVERGVKKLSGIQAVNVNLLTNSMMVEYDEAACNTGAIVQAVISAGYSASPEQKAATSVPQQDAVSAAQKEISGMKKRLILSFVFLIPLMYVSMGHMLGLPLPAFLHGSENAVNYAFLQFLLTLPVIYFNRKYYQVGYRTLFHGNPNMDSLIAIGSSAALVYGIFVIFRLGYATGHGQWDVVEKYGMDLYFESAAMILTLITLGKFLETRSKGKTSEAITKLMDLAPKTATIIKDGQETVIPVEEVQVGDLIVIRPGQSVPVDGIITEGGGALDLSAITGESLPVEKTIGDTLPAAAINRTGYIVFRATKVGDDTTLSQIIRLVQEAASSKAPISKLADKISGIFVPTVISIAIVAAVIWMLVGKDFEFALSIGISVLVISCPCALGLATPVAIMVGTGKGASLGVLIKNAEALQTVHEVKAVVLDKTGTLTEGKPRITDMLPADGIAEQELLRVAAALEQPSEHPLSHVIVEEAEQRGIKIQPVTDFQAVSGRGILAVFEGLPCAAGNLAMMKEAGVDVSSFCTEADKLAAAAKTPLYFARGGTLLGVIAVADIIKPTSREAIQEFDRLGLEVIMLTGDNERTARAIAEDLQIKNIVAEVLPGDKEKKVRELQEAGKKVAMVGDGINDSPALARADVGIAIGAGTDIAIESADIVLMKSDLRDAATAISLSRSVMRTIKQNLFWAFCYNSIGIPIAAGVLFTAFGLKLSPMLGAAAMSLSSVCVVTNALRLKFFKPAFKQETITETTVEKPLANTIPEETKGETENMKKIMKIDGMMCPHCKARVEKVLSAIPGVQAAEAILEEAAAHITLTEDVSDDVLTKAITDAGYEVRGIE